MKINKKLLDYLYFLSACAKYNPERSIQIEDVFKKVMYNPLLSYNIESNLDEHFKEIKNSISQNTNILTTLFRDFDRVRSSLFNTDDYNDFIKSVYKPLSRDFLEYYGFSLELYCRICTALFNYIIMHLFNLEFSFDVYEFKNQGEYADFSFAAIPKKKYRKKWMKAVTFSLDDIISKDQKDDSFQDVTRVIDLLSFSIADLNNIPKLRFQDKPIIKISETKLFTPFPVYLISNIIQRLETLFLSIRTYRDNKGKFFEKKVMKILNTIPKKKVIKNIRYGKFELDGILNLDKVTWFIECSSHPPKFNSYMEDELSIINDINRSISKCEDQALRAIRHKEHPNIKKHCTHQELGVMIIINGLYPNLNRMIPYEVIPKKSNLRRYIISYFDLLFLMKQPQKHLFDEYLTWRTQDRFPINGIDETDVWTWFLNYYNDPKSIEGFKQAQTNNNSIEYIGNRFMDKRYLNKIAKK